MFVVCSRFDALRIAKSIVGKKNDSGQEAWDVPSVYSKINNGKFLVTLLSRGESFDAKSWSPSMYSEINSGRDKSIVGNFLSI